MVAVGGDRGGGGTAEYFREIKLVMAGIGAGDKNPAYRVTGAMDEPALAGLEEAGILVQQGRKCGSDHEAFGGAVGACGGVTLAVAFGALAKTRFTVFRLADAGQKAVPGK